MTEEDKEFIYARMVSPEISGYASKLLCGTDGSIEELKKQISYLPHLQQYEFAIILAGPDRYKLLLP